MTGEIGSHNESSEPSYQLVQQESAALLRLLLSQHNIQHCVFLTSPLRNGPAVERSGQRNVPLPASGAVGLRSLWYPQACGERGGEGPAHLIVPSLLTLENLQLILPVQ